MKTTEHACDQLVCLLSHELLNKLSIIVGHSQLLQDPNQSPDKVTIHLREILVAAKSMAESLQHYGCFPPQKSEVTSIANHI